MNMGFHILNTSVVTLLYSSISYQYGDHWEEILNISKFSFSSQTPLINVHFSIWNDNDSYKHQGNN